MVLMVAPLAGWNARGYSYSERQQDGQLHPGADFNVGGGDEDLGLPVVSCAAGVVVARRRWSGTSFGFGNIVLVEHDVAGVKLWGQYAHLDGLYSGADVGAGVAPGDLLGWCGKSGRQTWAHLHFELRHRGPDVLPIDYWGGALTIADLSYLYADPFTLLRVLGGMEAPSTAPAPDLGPELAHWQAKAFGFEDYLRGVAGRRVTVPRAIVDRIVSRVPPVSGGG